MRSQQLDSADYKQRQAADVDRTIGLEAWANGTKTLENSPNDPFMKASGVDVGPGMIPSTQPLSDDDRAAIQAGAAVRAFAHDAQLSDADKQAVEEGKAVVLPRAIASNRTDNLSATDLEDLSSGRATITPATRPADPQYSKDRFGRTEVPANDLQRGLDSGAISLEDLASGKAKLVG